MGYALNSEFTTEGDAGVGAQTLREILSQPVLWRTTLRDVHDAASSLHMVRQLLLDGRTTYLQAPIAEECVPLLCAV